LAGDVIPEDIHHFVLTHIDSVAQLEALLLLQRNPNETWTAAGAAHRLYIDEREALKVLEHLCGSELITCSEQNFRFSSDPEVQNTVERLGTVYSRQLITITNLIHSKPRRLREFSDAFKIWKDKP
jgi:hypothetical protein